MLKLLVFIVSFICAVCTTFDPRIIVLIAQLSSMTWLARKIFKLLDRGYKRVVDGYNNLIQNGYSQRHSHPY